jgi:nitroreductase
LNEETLMRVFECARWAASSFNEQPWRFLIARSEEDRQKFLSFLMPANQVWAKNAPVLVLVIPRKPSAITARLT